MLSLRAREAIKLALAVVIAYGIALSLDWDKPLWAGFAVIFTSLATVGQSFNKAALRMLGTLLGAVVAVVLLALFVQERWLFITWMALWVGVCTYLMAGERHGYFWNVSGFVCVVICMDAGPDPANVFHIVTTRTLETALGILVYSLVSLFIWPVNSGSRFTAAVKSQQTTQKAFFDACAGQLSGKQPVDVEQLSGLWKQASQAQSQADEVFPAASTDNLEVKQYQQQWQSFQRESAALNRNISRWCEDWRALQAIDLHRLVPGYASFTDAVQRRLADLPGMLEGQNPEAVPEPVELVPDAGALTACSQFDRAALAVALKRMRQIEELSRSMHRRMAFMQGLTQDEPAHSMSPPEAPPFDPDRLGMALRSMAIVWLAYLLAIYFDGIPGGLALVTIAVPNGMAISTMALPVSKLFMPAATGVALGAFAYIFIMPHLSGFAGLGTLLFTATFLVAYLFSEPRQVLGKLFGLALMLVLMDVSNQQSYSFLSVANKAMMFPILFTIFALVFYFPVSLQPQKVFPRLLRRFLYSGEQLLASMEWTLQVHDTRWRRLRRNWHMWQLRSLKSRLAHWAGRLDAAIPTQGSPAAELAMRAGLLASRFETLLEVRGRPQADMLVGSLTDDIRQWRQGVQNTLRDLRHASLTDSKQALEERLSVRMDSLEARIRQVLDSASSDSITPAERANFYRLLGAYRGISTTLIEYAGVVGDADWLSWRQPRFT